MLMAMLRELLMAAPALVIVMVVALVVIGPTQGPRQVGYGRWGAADGGSRVVVVDRTSLLCADVALSFPLFTWIRAANVARHGSGSTKSSHYQIHSLPHF